MSFQETFHTKIIPRVGASLGITNVMALPRPTKVTVSVGIGSRVRDKKDFSDIEANLAKITGQKPKLILARKSVSNFKLREGMPNALLVTLRGKRMFDFLERLVNVALPRVRDFRGLPLKALDRQGNYALGLREHIVFPEASGDDISKIHGLSVTISTTAKNGEEGETLLREMGFPLQKKDKSRPKTR